MSLATIDEHDDDASMTIVDDSTTSRTNHFYRNDGPATSGSRSRSVSPAPTLETLSSSLYENLFDSKHGRKVNSTCATYSMAADEHEIVRMDREHRMYRFLFRHRFQDDLFIGPVHSLLTEPDPGHPEPKRVYDLGTGTAAWAIDVANRFPRADVVGIDLVPVQPHSDDLPVNCRVEVDDLNLSLDHYDNTASLVHIRLLSSGITDYPGLIDKCSGMLKLGGLVHILETDFRPYYAPEVTAVITGSKGRRRTDPMYSPTVNWLNSIVNAMHQKHANVDAAANMRRWIREHRSLDEVAYQEEWLPLFAMFPNDTPENRFLNDLSRMVVSDFQYYMHSARPITLDVKSAREQDALEEDVAKEIRNPKYQVYVRVVIICARKVPKMPVSPVPLSPAGRGARSMEF